MELVVVNGVEKEMSDRELMETLYRQNELILVKLAKFDEFLKVAQEAIEGMGNNPILKMLSRGK